MSTLQKTLAALALLVSSSASAQIGSGTDIIMGRVVGPDSASLAGARVAITSLVTGSAREVTAGSDGRFTVLFRDGGGQYRLTATFVGMQPATVTARRFGNEDRLVVTIHMSGVAQQLERVEVVERAEAFETAFKAGGAERTLTPQLLERLPVNPGDLFGAALLVPGVLATAVSDTSRAAFSIAAQPSVQNNVTLDGMTYLFGSVPQEAISAIRLFSNTYDVSRGQFTGGQLATTTRAGTNRFERAANISYRPTALQSGGPGGSFAQTFSHLLASGGISGPFSGAGSAFYSVSGELQHHQGPALTLQSASSGTLELLGVHPDSLIRVGNALQQIGAAHSGMRARDHSTLEGSGLARFDLDVTPNNQLMLRADLRGSRMKAIRVSPYSSNGGDGGEDAFGGGGMVMLSSVLGKFINEFRGYGSWEQQRSDPTIRAPAGVVTVTSTLDDRSQITTLHFGGNQMLPRVSRATLQEASNELSFLTEDGAHRWKVGVMVNRERAEITGISDRYGTYLYNSVANLETNTPAKFARTLPGTGRLVGTDNGALYLANAWRKNEKLHMTYGFRIEASRLAESPPENPFVIAVFDRSTRNFLTEMRMYPRFGLTYLIGDAGEPSAIVSLGIGEFRGRVPSHLLQYVNTNDGFASDSQMVCVGSFIPAADWSSFNADTSTIPRNCVVSSRLPLGEVRPNVAFWGQDAGAPRVWRSALNVE